MKKQKKIKMLTAKASEITMEKMKFICDFYGLNRSIVLRSMIDSEYVKIEEIKKNIQKKQKTN